MICRHIYRSAAAGDGVLHAIVRYCLPCPLSFRIVPVLMPADGDVILYDLHQLAVPGAGSIQAKIIVSGIVPVSARMILIII